MASVGFKFFVDGVLKNIFMQDVLRRNSDFEIIDIQDHVYVPTIPVSDTDLTLPSSLWIKSVDGTPNVYEVYKGDLLLFRVNADDGNLLYGIGDVSVVPVELGGTGAETAEDARTNLELGSASTKTAGTGAGNVLLLDEANKLPALDATNLINVPTAPVGSLILLAGNVAATGTLIADGSLLLRASYPALFAQIGETYGAGDGTTTFRLPDWRGVFFRGLDLGRGLDISRVLGTLQTDAIRNLVGWVQGDTCDGQLFYANGSAGGQVGHYIGGGNIKSQFDASRVVPTAAENRPVNHALLACIKY